MAVDVSQPGSPAWWMHRLGSQFPERRQRLQRLHDWYRGDPPVEDPPKGYDEHRRLMRQSRTNWAAMAVNTKRQRMRVRAVRTSVDSDLSGDEEALRLLRETGLLAAVPTLNRLWLTMGVSYVAVGVADDGTLVASVEDGRDMTHEADAAGRVRVALKLTRDDVRGEHQAWLWLREDDACRLYVARRAMHPLVALPGSVLWSPWDFTLDPEPVAEWPLEDGVPIEVFATEDGLGEFEPHIDVLERINAGVFRRDSIALVQAFRQRALEDTGGPEDGEIEAEDENGEKVDLDDILTADPGVVWTLPRGTKLWESGQVELLPLEHIVREDIKKFCAVTAILLASATPDAAAQTAEGASVQREDNTFATEDRCERAGYALARVVSRLLRLAGQPERANLRGIVVEWAPIERPSLGERAAAATAAKASGTPWETIHTDIWGYDAEKVERMRAQRQEDLLFAVGAATDVPVAAAPAPAPAAVPEPPAA